MPESVQIPEDAKSPPDAELTKVLFDERMVMVRHLVGKADRAEAEYFFRTLVEQVKYLSRKHGLELRK